MGKQPVIKQACTAPYLPDFTFVPADQQYAGVLYVLHVLLALNCFGMTSHSVLFLYLCEISCSIYSDQQKKKRRLYGITFTAGYKVYLLKALRLLTPLFVV